MVSSLYMTTPVEMETSEPEKNKNKTKERLPTIDLNTVDEDLLYSLETAFFLHDHHKGYLTKNELGTCLRDLGHNPTEKYLWELMAEIDVDHDGKVDFKEFVSLYINEMMDDEDPSVDLAKCWNVLDPCRRGNVSLNELSILWTRTCSTPRNFNEFDNMFENVKEKRKIDFEDFMTSVFIPDKNEEMNNIKN